MRRVVLIAADLLVTTSASRAADRRQTTIRWYEGRKQWLHLMHPTDTRLFAHPSRI